MSFETVTIVFVCLVCSGVLILWGQCLCFCFVFVCFAVSMCLSNDNHLCLFVWFVLMILYCGASVCVFFVFVRFAFHACLSNGNHLCLFVCFVLVFLYCGTSVCLVFYLFVLLFTCVFQMVTICVCLSGLFWCSYIVGPAGPQRETADCCWR